MSKPKSNISRWYSLGLGALLVAGCLMLGIGTTFARYRTDAQTGILFEPRVPITVTLGRMNGENNEFDSTAPIGWEMQPDGSMRMNLVVSTPEQQDKPLDFRVRFLGSLHAWSGKPTDESTETTTATTDATTEETFPLDMTPQATVILTDGTRLEDDTEQVWTAEVMRIPPNSALYHSFGEGWVFRFLDEEGEELTWTLENGQLSCVELNITISGDAFTGTSLLQLQVVAEHAK